MQLGPRGWLERVGGWIGKKRQTFAQNYCHPPNPCFKTCSFPLPLLSTTSICKTKDRVVRQYCRGLKHPTIYGWKGVKVENSHALDSCFIEIPEDDQQQSLTTARLQWEGKAVERLFFTTPPPIKTSWLQAGIKSCFPNWCGADSTILIFPLGDIAKIRLLYPSSCPL